MAVKPLLRFGDLAAADFGPKALKILMDDLQREPSRHKDEQGRPKPAYRTTVNAKVKGIWQLFKWAASEELVPVTVFQRLRTVALLQKGRTSARESEGVAPVSSDVFESTLTHLPLLTCPPETAPLSERESGSGANQGRQPMPRGKKELAEQIIPKLREVEVEVGRGKTVLEAVKKIGVTEQTYYRWKKKFGGLRIDQAKRLKDLEKENSRLKRLLADAELDKAILREAASGNF
jgi:hypothetical protein